MMHTTAAPQPSSPEPGTAPGALFTRTPNLAEPDTNRLRASMRRYFLDTFDRYESLFQCLASDEAYFIKPISLRHPLIFYFGHTATFFVNKLMLTRLIDQRLDHRLESIFAVGVDEMSWDDLDDAHYDWPSVAEVRAYRGRVRALVLDLIDHAPLQDRCAFAHRAWCLGLERCAPTKDHAVVL